MSTFVQQSSLVTVLLEQHLLTQEQGNAFWAQAQESHQGFLTLVQAHGGLSQDELVRALATQYGLPFDPLADFRVNFQEFPSIAPDWMRRYTFVPVTEEEGRLTIALAAPLNLKTLDHIERLLRREVSVIVSPQEAILEALQQSEQSNQVITRVQAEFRPVLIQENAQGDEVISVETVGKDDSPIVRLVNTTILGGLTKRASDIHIEPTDHELVIKFRIDGILYLAMEPLDMQFHGPIVSRIKVMSDLDIAERRVPQDGRFKLRTDGRTVDFRVSILPSAFGEAVVIRILAKDDIAGKGNQLSLDVLGLKADDLRRFRRSITASYGMVLVTGPTGSGKTTTLYAAINEVNMKEDKIITIEDPVEYQLKGVIQVPVNEKKGLTFARGLRSILRHDPDKIMVGEIRDAETAQIAIQSALTGHLVFTTVHANNAFDVIGRFVNMGIEPYNFVSSLNCIMAQRLVRTICRNCKVAYSLSPSHCEEYDLDPAVMTTIPVYQGKGCLECHGLGYRGRSAITEFLTLTDPIKELILDRRPTSEICRAAMAEGMTTLREAGLKKVIRGETTVRELNRVSFAG